MVKIGIIGAGGIAEIHAESYKHIFEAEVVAVADIIQERAKKIAHIFDADVYEDADKIIARDDIDIVDLCVPTYLHHKYVLKAAKANKNIFCEKPIAINIDEAYEMLEVTKANNVKFMVGHVLRYFPENLSAYQEINNGSIGLPKIIRTYRGGPNPALSKKWYGEYKKSGGAIQDMLIHDIDFLRWCFGPVKEVFARGNIFDRNSVEDPEYDLLILEFYNGVMAHLVADWSGDKSVPFTTKLEIAGTEGLVEYNSNDSIPLKVQKNQQNNDREGNVAIPESPLSPLSSPYAKELKAFIKSVKNNTEPPISGQDALEALRIALAANKSIYTNKPIQPKEVL